VFAPFEVTVMVSMEKVELGGEDSIRGGRYVEMEVLSALMQGCLEVRSFSLLECKHQLRQWQVRLEGIFHD
jgi:hypothetical protein